METGSSGTAPRRARGAARGGGVRVRALEALRLVRRELLDRDAAAALPRARAAVRRRADRGADGRAGAAAEQAGVEPDGRRRGGAARVHTAARAAAGAARRR